MKNELQNKRRAKATPRRRAAPRGSAYRRLKSNAVLQSGDRRIYCDYTMGVEIYKHEIGMTVAESGYFGVVRKKNTPNDLRERPATQDSRKPKTL